MSRGWEEEERQIIEMTRQIQEEQRKQARTRYRKNAFGASFALHQYTFDRDSGQVSQLNYARRYVEHWADMVQHNQGLLLWGPTGTGKTFAAACIANALVDQLVEVYMTTLGEVLLKLFGMSGEERITYFDRLAECQLLILDDFGMERRTSYAQEQVYELVNRRYLSGKPLIVTTNLTPEDFHQEPDLARRRINDRVWERCTPIRFDGANLRQERAADNLRWMRTMLGEGSAPEQEIPSGRTGGDGGEAYAG